MYKATVHSWSPKDDFAETAVSLLSQYGIGTGKMRSRDSRVRYGQGRIERRSMVKGCHFVGTELEDLARALGVLSGSTASITLTGDKECTGLVPVGYEHLIAPDADFKIERHLQFDLQHGMYGSYNLTIPLGSLQSGEVLDLEGCMDSIPSIPPGTRALLDSSLGINAEMLDFGHMRPCPVDTLQVLRRGGYRFHGTCALVGAGPDIQVSMDSNAADEISFRRY